MPQYFTRRLMMISFKLSPSEMSNLKKKKKKVHKNKREAAEITEFLMFINNV